MDLSLGTLILGGIITPEEAVDDANSNRYLASVASNRRPVKTQTCNGVIVHDERE
jgi:hypothetical protein